MSTSGSHGPGRFFEGNRCPSTSTLLYSSTQPYRHLYLLPEKALFFGAKFAILEASILWEAYA
jgi:hypothetical protein